MCIYKGVYTRVMMSCVCNTALGLTSLISHTVNGVVYTELFLSNPGGAISSLSVWFGHRQSAYN